MNDNKAQAAYFPQQPPGENTMTPDRAHAIYVALPCRGEFPATDDTLDALATLAAMRVEEDWRIVPTDSNGGKYETRRHTRLVTEWVAG